MFNSYDFTGFSMYLKQIRNINGISREDLSEATGLNRDTLRKIENGYSIPTYQSLAILSEFYKIDLCEKFSHYKSSMPLHSFYTKANKLISLHKYDELMGLYVDFKEETAKIDDFYLIYHRHFRQIELFFEAIALRYTQKKSNLMASKSLLVEALRIGISEFDLNRVDQFQYSSFELRILLVLANVMGDLKNIEASNQMVLFILSYMTQPENVSDEDYKFQVKIYALLSYNAYRRDFFEQSLDYAQIGIEMNLKNNLSESLDFLLIRKGIAMFYLDKLDYLTPLNQAIMWMELNNNFEALEKTKSTLRRVHHIMI